MSEIAEYIREDHIIQYSTMKYVGIYPIYGVDHNKPSSIIYPNGSPQAKEATFKLLQRIPKDVWDKIPCATKEEFESIL